MRTRNGFVSNSSSSSFVIVKAHLSPLQLEQIRNHMDVARKGMRASMEYLDQLSSFDEWSIEEDDFVIKGSTWMDNFEMDEFLKLIGVPEEKIEWTW